MPLLHLLRHGQIDWPLKDCFIGQTDAPLSDAGREEILAWCDRLRDLAFGAVWSSDLRRAVQSAELLCSGRESEIKVTGELREVNLGEWEERPRDQVRASFPELWKARGEDFAGFRPPGGESFSDLQKRVVACVSRICADSSTPVLAVTHAGVIRVLICAVLGMPLSNLFRFQIDCASLTIVDFSESAEAKAVRAVNVLPKLKLK